MNGAAAAVLSCPSAAAIIPSHITGATAGAASTFAGSETSDVRSNWTAISGAVPIVAATVNAIASANPAGTRRRRSAAPSGPASTMIAATAAKLSCHPASSTARGLSPSVTAAARMRAYAREAGRPASVAATPAAPMTPARWIDGPPPASGTYSAIAPRASRSAPQPDPEHRREREHEGAEQHHVLPARRDEVRQPGAPGNRRACVGERLVLAENHAAQQRRLRRRQAPPQRILRALAHAVERTGHAAAAASGRRDPVGVQHRVHVARAQPRIGRPEPLEDPVHRELLADPHRRPGHARARPHEHALATEADEPRSARRTAAGAPARAATPARSRHARDARRAPCGRVRASRASATTAPPSSAPATASVTTAPRATSGHSSRQASTATGARGPASSPSDGRANATCSGRARTSSATSRASGALDAEPRQPGPVTAAPCPSARRAFPDAGHLAQVGDALKPPCCVRQAMIFCAVAGPTPSSVSSCSAVALFRLTGGPLAAPDAPALPAEGRGDRATARPHRDDDLLAVDDLRGEVDRVDVAVRTRAAGALHGVLHTRPRGKPVDAGLANCSGDVDDRPRGRRRATLTPSLAAPRAAVEADATGAPPVPRRAAGRA